jgi:hypothetical protein
MKHHKPWSERSVGSRILVVAAIAVAVPSFVALFAAVTMWLWNALMPAIFRLPEIGFWQAVGLLILSQILFKGGHAGRAGRAHWRRSRFRERMREEGLGPEARPQ